MFDKRLPPEKFPCFLSLNDDRLKIQSQEHYSYLNDMADKLYQEVHGYKSQPDFDYFCSSHPQESSCFCVALTMDNWTNNHEFNEES